MNDDVRTPAARVVLVRHARSLADPATPAGTWGLHPDAPDTVRHLAAELATLGVDGIATSPELKTVSTARIIADTLGLPLSEDEAVREQGLDTTPWIPEPDGFRAAVADHFARKDDAVFGDESSSSAATRFAAGVERMLAAHRLPVIVTHGRVLCGYLREAIGIDPMDVWPTLRMPDAFVVDLDRKTLERVNGGA